MSRKVFVIHNSEIVRKGIVAILRSYFNFEYVQYAEIKDLKPKEDEFENGLLFIFLELADSIDLSAIHKLREKNTVKIIGICRSKVESKNIHGFTNCIS